MYRVLYRKYRPQTFRDVVGQAHVTSTLQHELEAGRLSHAYLFTGTRGTGKTTCARLLSRAVNCLTPVEGNPCNHCEICTELLQGTLLDVIEIDAASNSGVDNIRDLCEEANFTPVRAKYRVYIIDEVHMLTTQAFNALLKIMEEPPGHVIFILATTEVHKIPATILSRCQRFDFHRLPAQRIAERLTEVAQREGFVLEPQAAQLIARISDGALRDALSLLDRCISQHETVTAEVVTACAGLTGKGHIFSLADSIAARQTQDAIRRLHSLYADSCDMEQLCGELLSHMRDLMIMKTVERAQDILICTDTEWKQFQEQATRFTLDRILQCLRILEETLFSVKREMNKRVLLEMTLIRLCTPELDTDISALSARISALEEKLRDGIPVTARMDSKPSASLSAELQEQPNNTPEEEAEADPQEEDDTQEEEEEETPLPGQMGLFAQEETAPAGGNFNWEAVLSALAVKNPALYGLICGVTVSLEQDVCIIEGSNPSLAQFLEIGSNAQTLQDAMRESCGSVYPVQFRNSPKQAAKSNDPLAGFADKINTLF